MAEAQEKTKRPAFQFYPADWRKDVELQSCSMAAQGLWINVMCIAHECEPYGHLMVNGKPMTPAQIGRQVGLSLKECEALLAELMDAGVIRRTEQGAYFSKRMVQDEATRNARAAGGKSGAEHGSKGASHGKKGGRPPQTKGGSETPLPPKEDTPLEGVPKPPPSSSSSSSSSISSVTDVTDGSPSKPQKITDPKEIIFGYGVTMLVNAGTADKQARTFLGGLIKTHGEAELINKLRECAQAKPLQPLTWLAAAMPPPKQPTSKQEQLERRNQQVGEDWEAEMLAQAHVVEA